MPRTDPDLAAKMPDTMRSLRAVVERLEEAGVKKREIAESSGWSAGYLSQALTEKRIPAPDKLRELVRVLHLLAGNERPAIAHELREVLAPVAERYDLVLRPLSPPTGLISEEAPNYIVRPELTRFLDNHVSEPGIFLLDGPPLVGLTTATRAAATRLRNYGYEVLELSAKRDFVDSRFLERARPPRVLGAIAAHLQSLGDDAAVLELGFAARGFIRERLTSFPRGFALVIDELDALPDEDVRDYLAFLRDWREMRGRGEPGFANSSVWGSFTSDTSDIRDRSRFFADAILSLNWFSVDEVRELAAKLVPKAVGKADSREWATTVAERAVSHFAGQPQLTHQFVWDSTRGELEYDPALDAPPAGRYKLHLDRLCDTMIGLCGAATARDIVKLVAGGEPLPLSLRPLEVSRLRIVGDHGRWSASFYARHLPDHLEERIARQPSKIAAA